MPKRPIPEPTPRTEAFAELRRECEQLCARVIEFTYLMEQSRQRDDLTIAEQVDVGFLSRDASDYLDKAKKRLRSLQDALSLDLGRKVMLTLEDDVHAQSVLAGRYATGSVDVKVVPLTPSRTDPAFKQGLRELGIADDLIECDAIDLRWNGLADLVRKRAGEGARIPSALRHESTPYVVFRRRRDSGLST